MEACQTLRELSHSNCCFLQRRREACAEIQPAAARPIRNCLKRQTTPMAFAHVKVVWSHASSFCSHRRSACLNRVQNVVTRLGANSSTPRTPPTLEVLKHLEELH